MKIEFEGSKEDFQMLVGGALMQTMAQMAQRQSSSATSSYHQNSEGWQQMQPLSGHTHLHNPYPQQPQPQPQHLPALPPSYSQPVTFAEYRQAQMQYARAEATRQAETINPTPVPTSNSQPSTFIPQPFIPSTQQSVAIVPANTMTAEIVPSQTDQVQVWAQSFYQWLYTPTASVVSVVLFVLACYFLLTPIVQDIRTKHQISGQMEVKPSPSPSPIPTIQAKPKAQPKPQAKPAPTKSNVADFPCLPLPVTEKGC